MMLVRGRMLEIHLFFFFHFYPEEFTPDELLTITPPVNDWRSRGSEHYYRWIRRVGKKVHIILHRGEGCSWTCFEMAGLQWWWTFPCCSHLHRLKVCVLLFLVKIFNHLGFIWSLAKIQSTIHLQWIPVHSRIPGSEAAEARAKEATTNRHNLECLPILLESTSTIINRFVKDPQPSHERTC